MTIPGGRGGEGQGGPGGSGSQPTQGSRVLVYAPDVNVYFATQSGVIDVSHDIVKGEVKRVTDGVSQATVVLNNQKKQWTRVIQRMDRVVIFMTRVKRLQVFAGYVDTAPFLDLYPSTCTIQASCTLKRLLYTYWDPGLVNSMDILDQNTYNPSAGGGAGAPGAGGGAGGGAAGGDSGLGAMLTNLLVRVGGWDANSIKIQNFPPEFLAFAAKTNPDPEAYRKAIEQMQTLLGLRGGGGSGSGGGLGTAPAPGEPGGVSSPGSTGGTGPGAPAYNGSIPQAAGSYGGTSLDSEQLGNANAIAAAGQARGASQQAINTALMTSMQESQLRNLNYGDRDSLGLFQQRPSQGWGSPAQIQDPTYSSNKFYDGLDAVPGWQQMAPTQAAQAVQRSAYPNAYAKWQPMAEALTAGGAGTGAVPPPPPGQAPPGGTPDGQPPPAGGQQPGGTTGGGGAGGADAPPYAYGLFNSMFNTGAFISNVSALLTGERALINDQQLMTMIQAVTKAGLRSFQSAPTGEFMAWYPDYFGIHSSSATFTLEDIEMKNVSIQISDAPLATHVFTAGDVFTEMGTIMNTSPELAYMETQGIVTVENQDVFKLMMNVDPTNAQDFSAQEIYRRFGARPLVMNMPMLKSPLMEKFQALYLFMQKWAEQYATRVETTFLPEVFPGMRLELSGHSLTVYVQEVVHHFDRKLGFSTDLVIMAPSTSQGGLPGMPVSRGEAGNLPLSGPGG